MKKLNYLIIAGLFLVSVSAKPNLPNVDYAALFFQGTTSAHPIKKVTALPATCVAVGGANSSNAILYQGRIYICSSTDTWTATSTGSGTVTSVGLILGTSGTDAGVSGSPITGSGSFTLNLPTASASNRGLLSTSDWSTFNSKYGNGATPSFGAITSSALTSGRVPIISTSGLITDDSGLIFDSTNDALGIGLSNSYRLHITGAAKGTVFYGLTSSTVASGDTINLASVSNAITGSVKGFDYQVPASTGFNNLFYNTDSTSVDAHSVMEVKTGGASGGDPKVMYTINGVLNWAHGIDNSDSDSWVLSVSNLLGNSNAIRVTTARNVDFPVSMSVGAGTTITKHLSSTATLNFANQAAIGCEVLTITVTGAALGDTVAIGVPNASDTTTSTFYGWVSATNTVSVKHCALVSGDPASGTFRADVWQH